MLIEYEFLKDGYITLKLTDLEKLLKELDCLKKLNNELETKKSQETIKANVK